MNGRFTLQSGGIWLPAILLVVVILLSGWFRYTGLLWDDGHHLHPDERFLMMVTASLEVPQSPAEYFDSSASGLNPRNRGFDTFVYGTLPTTLLRLIGEVTGRTGYGELLLPGRALSATADMVTVLLCLFLGVLVTRRWSGGILTSALYGFCVLPIQHAHFFVVDALATMFIAGALTVLVWHQRVPAAWKWLLGAGLWGAALACKLSIYTFFAVPVALAVWHAWTPGNGLRGQGEARKYALERVFFRLVLFVAVAFLMVRILMPDAFRGPGPFDILPEERWLANVEEARRLVSGEVDFPPGHQWTGRAPYWFPWSNMVLWGLGPALGLLAWGTFGWAAWKAVRFRHVAAALPAFWVAALFLHQGGQWVMSLRYFLPMYPALAVLAAWALLELHGRGQRRFAWGIGSFVVAATVLWALAFTSIYRAPHTRVEASRWILDNIPAGSAIGNEVWDDALPLRIDGTDPFGESYTGVDLHWYPEDDAAKLDSAIGWLEEADYIVLSSNRLYDSIRRLSMRYPMTTRYYESLFSGELGFERVAEFTSYPTLAGVSFPDQRAEEAFSVYDHPRVQIFRKSESFDGSEVRRILEDALNVEIVRLTPKQEAAAPGGLRFSAREWERRQRTALPLPNRRSSHSVLDVVAFYALLTAFGLIGAPILFHAFACSPDRGWALARLVGLVLVSWTAWLGTSLQLVLFSRMTLILACAAMGIVSAIMLHRSRESWRDHLLSRWKLLVLGETVFLLGYVGLVLIRVMNPDLWHPSLGGEKPMNMAYLNAVLRSGEFPPHGPWHAGSTMNYYYFGYVLSATPIRLLGIVPEVGYNLVVAGFYGMLLHAAFGCGAALLAPTSPQRQIASAGLLAAVLLGFAGNLRQLEVAWKALRASTDRPEAWFWDATRAISHPPSEAGPITEFPFFTYLFGDLHPHLMSLPVFVGILWCALMVSRVRKASLPLLFLTALLLGTAWVTNPWDLPTAVVLLAAALILPSLKRGLLSLGLPVALLFLIVLTSKALYAPFHISYGAPYGSFELWRGSRTPLLDYLLIHGLLLLLVIPPTLLFLWARPQGGSQPLLKFALVIGSVVLAVALLGLPAFLLAAFLATACALWRRPPEDDRVFPLLLICLSLLIGLGVEAFVLKGDISRMNTVFKFYLHAWVLLAMAAAASVVWVDATLCRAWKTVWRALAGFALAAGLVYPFSATPARVAHRMTQGAPASLDGLAFLTAAEIEVNGVPVSLRDDLDGIRWLRDNVKGLPVLAEATTHPVLYGWGGRFSIHTGLPTVIGWDWHMRQQLAALPTDVVTPRVEDMKRLYSTTDAAEAMEITHRYNVEYVMIGDLERALFPPEGLEKFAKHQELWSLAYRTNGLRIYAVTRDKVPDR